MPPSLYGAADSDLLAAYCQAVATHRRATEALRNEGAVIGSPNGAPYQNPWVGIQNRQAQIMASLGSRLGLDPVARGSLSVPEGEEAPSKFQGLVAIEGGKGEDE
jgi:P27 family predicted phage terminase small subunit